MAKGPQVDRKDFSGVGSITKRLRGSSLIYDNRDELAEQLLMLASANITDVIEWSDQHVRIKEIKEIPERAISAIKKIKVTPTRNGDQIEVEMIDKVRLLQLLSKSAGLLDQEKDSEKPAVVDIQMVMPGELEKKK
tara:strand:+ start:51 stop:458 length:408 start_codon:yes stop_codon:yes gene_type:complete